MKKTTKRVISTIMALSMMLGLSDWSVFADENYLVATVTATYTDASETKFTEEESITVDTSGNITLNIHADYKAGTASTVEIYLPMGIELDVAPGVSSATSTTYTEASSIDGQFNGYPTWSPLTNVTSESSYTYTSASGTLTYDMSTSYGSHDFIMYVSVNPVYVPVGTESIESLLGDIKVTVTSGSVSTYDILPVTVKSQAANLSFNTFTLDESMSNSLSNNTIRLIAGSSDSTVTMSADGARALDLSSNISFNASFADANYTVKQKTAGFTISIPSEATYEAGSDTYTLTKLDVYNIENDTYYYYDKTADKNDEYDEYTYSSVLHAGYQDIQRSVTTAMNVISSNGKITDNSGDFMTVDWQEYFDDDETYKLSDYLETGEDSYTTSVYASDLFVIVESYNISEGEFEYVTIKSVADDTDVESTAIVVEELTKDNSIYAPSYGSARNDSETYNLYDNATQTLYTVRRESSPSNTSAYFDTVLPVMFEYKQLTVDGDYLDNVSKVVMTIPFLGSDEYPRYMSSVESLTVWYDNEQSSESDAYPIDISTFSNSLTGENYDTYSSYNAEVIAATVNTPAVNYSYTASTPSYPYIHSTRGQKYS